jgi:hypothetical protein
MINPSRQIDAPAPGEPHLDADAVDVLALVAANGGEFPADEAAHLAHCRACRLAVDDRSQVLQDVRTGVDALVDAAFDDAALNRQRVSILDRLAARRDGGRVLVFPPRDLRNAPRDRPTARWLAAAAAAGLLVGLLAGQRLQPVLRAPALALFGGSHESAIRPAGTRVAGAHADPVLVHAHDELFLSEMETAVTYRGVAELRALDGLTPDPVSGPARFDR